MSSTRHFTTRRGFVAAMGFSGLSLYGLWAAYGAAPTPATILQTGGHPEGAGGHAGHGAASDGLDVDEFRRLTAEFIARYRMPDGSVYPRPLPATAHEDHAGAHGAAAASMGHGDAGHGTSPASHGDAHQATEQAALDIYLLAEQWFYEPAHLRLDVGVPYRFRMMAADVAHGASFQFGRGGRMIRLRPNTVAELQASFTSPGSHLVYCTVYCGQAHDFMQARIDVV